MSKKTNKNQNADGIDKLIDNTFESLFIIGIHYQTEVSNNIFDFLALIER